MSGGLSWAFLHETQKDNVQSGRSRRDTKLYSILSRPTPGGVLLAMMGESAPARPRHRARQRPPMLPSMLYAVPSLTNVRPRLKGGGGSRAGAGSSVGTATAILSYELWKAL